MLTVLFLASGVVGNQGRSEPDPRRRLYLRFVRKMFGGPRTRRFSEEKALRWLGCLAAQLVNRDQIPFALEDLDQQWLPSPSARRNASASFRLSVGLLVGLVFGLAGGLIRGLGGGLIGGLGIGLVVGSLFRPDQSKESSGAVDALSLDWRRLPRALVGGLYKGLFAALLVGLSIALVGGLLVGLSIALVGGLLVGLVDGRAGRRAGRRAIDRAGRDSAACRGERAKRR